MADRSESPTFMGIVRKLFAFGAVDPKPIDYGDGLSMIPPAPPGKVFDGYPGEYIPLVKWAAQTWESYESGRASFARTGDGPSVCPSCYYLGMVETARLLSKSHHDAPARRNWARNMAEYQAQVNVLGGCRCAQKLTAGQAAFEAHEFNRPYYPGIS